MRKLVDLLFDRLKVRHFLVAVILLVPVSSFLLRQNNLNMIELRDKVLAVDADSGDINLVAPHIEELGNFVLNHMNTDVGVVDLPGTFNVAVEKLRAQAQASGSANADVYGQAQIACEDPGIPLTARAQCVQDFVVSNAQPGTDARELIFPDKSLFSYSFASPTWSPDLAGFSVLATTMSIIILVFLSLTRIVLPFIGRIIDRDPLE